MTKYLKFTYIDKRTGKSITERPADSGPAFPNVEGLSYEFALKSKWPIIGNNNYPLFFGTCPDSSDSNKPGILEELTESEYNEIKNKELEDRKRIKRRQVNNLRDSKIAQGKTYDFPDGTTGTVQLRNLEDKTNVQGLGSNALELKVEGDTTTTIPFRDMENTSHEMTADEMIQMGKTVSSFVQENYIVSWNHKDNIEECTTLDELENYDITINWPQN